jgi:threonine/homoserine/homoserine lactone efflux protein
VTGEVAILIALTLAAILIGAAAHQTHNAFAIAGYGCICYLIGVMKK